MPTTNDDLPDASDSIDDASVIFDLPTLRADAIAGAKALAYLFDHRADDWEQWVKTIRGLRGLRDLARHESGTRELNAFAYRQAIARLLSLRQYASYTRMDRRQRSACYRLMDNLDDVDDWYHGRVNYQGYAITDDDRMDWKSPITIVKHCPPQLLEGGASRRVTAPARQRLPQPVRPVVQAEIDRLRRLLAAVIRRLIRYEPEAAELLEQLQPADVPSDDISDVGATEDDA